MTVPLKVAVVGGGITGLAAAHTLRELSPAIEVVLLEAGSRLGGVLETTRRDDFMIEAAADNFLNTPPAATNLCRKLGLADSLIEANQSHRQAFVVHRGCLQPIPAGFTMMAPTRLQPILKSPLLSARGKLRAALEVIVPRRRTAGDESVASFVRRRFGREMLDRLVEPLIGGIYAGDVERLSVAATTPRLAQMEREHRSLLKAAFRHELNRKSQSVSGPRYAHFAALRNGMSSLVEALARSLPQRSIRLQSPVEALDLQTDRSWILSVGGDAPRVLPVNGVILATPAYRSAQLVASMDPIAAAYLREIEYGSSAVISFGYKRTQIQHPLNGFGFVVPRVEQRLILSCSFSSIKYEGRAPEGTVLLRVFLGGAGQQLMCKTDDELLELAEREVVDVLAIHGEPILRHLTRHYQATPQYHVGHLGRIATIERTLAKFPTLALAGSAYHGIGVPACIESGSAAAKRMLSELMDKGDLIGRAASRNVALV